MTAVPRLKAFADVARGRRSVRAFHPDPIPRSVLEACFDLAIVAPVSHNLECWRFIAVTDPGRREVLAHLCLDQVQAQQAPVLIVVVARPDLWREENERMRALLAGRHEPDRKYRVVVPLLFTDGPFALMAPVKRLITALIGWRRPIMRGPFGPAEQALWAVKSTALACQNLMLGLFAAGYGSCPLEGFDEARVRRMFELPHRARIVMVIAAGRPAPGGISERHRTERDAVVRWE